MRLSKDSAEKIPWARPALGEEELEEMIAAYRSGWLSSGPRVKRFEEQMANVAGRSHAVAVNNGTAALDLAVRVAGVLPGDEVIVPALSYLATASVLVIQGVRPIFVDVDPRNLCIDPEQVARAITRRTRAVLVTDHGGNPCDYPALEAICNEAGIPLILDGAQSIGSSLNGKKTLSCGLVSTTSFHAAKTITTVEGGMLFTDDAEIASRLRIMRSQGEDPTRKYFHVELGHNYRMTELQAAMGLAQLKKLERLLEDRQKLARQYEQEFAGLDLEMPQGLPGAINSQFLFTALLGGRHQVAAQLKTRGIETRSCYPLPLYEQPIFRHIRHTPCPVAQRVCDSILNPPMFFGLTLEQQKRIASEIKSALANVVKDSAPLRKAV